MIEELPLERIYPNAQNPRIDLSEISELATSIRELGVLVPLIVAPLDGTRDYLLLAGHRRRAAALEAGLEVVPVIVRDVDERTRENLMIAENLHRVALSPIEEARVFARIMRTRKLTQIQLAAAIHRSEWFVSTRLSLLRLPKDVIRSVHEGHTSIREALGLAWDRKLTDAGRKPRGLGVSLHRLSGHERCHPETCEISRIRKQIA